MKLLKYISIFIIILSCSSNDDSILAEDNLFSYTINKTVETGAVIACAGNDDGKNDVLVFLYPEIGATDVRLYETLSAEVDKDDFSNYFRIDSNTTPFFNGYLEKFTQKNATERWIIVTFELNTEIKISNPIRTKQHIKPTIWTSNIIVDQQQLGMPVFNWKDDEFGENAIYFQVISDAQNNLLSGTYTLDNQFQYYNTSNVVLNITTNEPPKLISGSSYNFTLMDVSEDNWVNTIIQKTFEAK